eukprot:scaffold110193_cov30-Tisochrysis_lutea.AAC.2
MSMQCRTHPCALSSIAEARSWHKPGVVFSPAAGGHQCRIFSGRASRVGVCNAGLFRSGIRWTSRGGIMKAGSVGSELIIETTLSRAWGHRQCPRWTWYRLFACRFNVKFSVRAPHFECPSELLPIRTHEFVDASLNLVDQGLE